MVRFTDFLVRRRLFLLCAALALTALGIEPASRLSFDQSVESLFAPDDPLLADYRRSKTWFGGEQMAAVAYTDPQLFSPAGLGRLRGLAEALERVGGVRRAQSLLDAFGGGGRVAGQSRGESAAQETPGSCAPVSSVPTTANPRSAAGTNPSLRLSPALRELMRGVILGDDNQTTAVVLGLEPEEQTKVSRDQTVRELRALAERHERTHGLATIVAGMPVMLRDVFRYLDEDGMRLGWASIVLLMSVILVLFRSLRWVILPIAVVQVTLVWTKALLVLAGLQLSMVSTMLSALVTVIGVATAVHITMRFRELRATLEPVEALRQTLMAMGPACLWTCLTTAAGFGVLVVTKIAPVRSFGLMLALGSMLVLPAAACVIPGGALLGRFRVDPQTAPGEHRLGQWLEALVRWVERRPRTVAFCSFALLALAGAGYVRLRIETDFTKNFRASSPIVQAYEFFENRMGGAANWEVIVPAPPQLNAAFYEKIERLAGRLRAVAGITKVTALPDGLRLFPGIGLLGPERPLQLVSTLWPDFVSGLWNREAGKMRIVLRARERQQADAKRALITEVRRVAKAEFPDAIVTGTFVLFTFLIESLMRDQLVTFALATLCIWLMLTVAFRSWKLAVVALVPNGCPIVVVIGVLGWLGLNVNMGTAMIACVSMGMAVDFSIHYLLRHQQERSRGQGFYDALARTHQSVGRSMVLASVALVAGFSVLCLSNFVPTVYFGILVSAAMLGGLAGNLVVLPLLLAIVQPKRPVPRKDGVP